jgi:hemin uptake protein HemP
MNTLSLRRAANASFNKAQSKLVAHAAPQSFDTGTLFAGNSEVIIAHGAEVYRLRLTRQNRLILTK